MMFIGVVVKKVYALSKAAKIIWASVLLEALLVAVIGLYALSNTSGHTGVNLYASYVIFMPAVILGIVIVAVAGFRKQLLLPGIFLFAGGMLGILLVLYLDQSNTLMQYDTWIKRGMP